MRERSRAIVGIGLVVMIGGCDLFWSNEAGKCERALTCDYLLPGGSGGGTPHGCVPNESADAVGDACGVFVASNGNDGSAGTKAEPVKTLSEAIARASEKGTAVYACAEEFAEAAEVPAGIAIFGGLDYVSGWKWIGKTKKTIVSAPGEAIALRLAAGEETTRIEDVAAHAADAKAPGKSSVAILIDGAKAELARCELVAGNGADGADGEHAPSDTPMQALRGNDGKAACSDLDGTPGPDVPVSGGEQVELTCASEGISIGGSGGAGRVNNGDSGQSGQSGALGAAGDGEPAMGNWSCAANGTGQGGDNGTAGDPGTAASGLGSLSLSGYAGPAGGAGTSGKPGQGGGGGGGAKGGMCSSGAEGAGASGGSGGAGGCGGLPGRGGGAGGASIALASVGGKVTLKDCTLKAGNGGKGGKGGDAQPGGQGGVGGAGGLNGNVLGFKAACAGGQGGQGGDGGPGGGGLGGHSLAIAYHGEPIVQQGATTLTPGTAGAGGPGGSNNVGANAGADGVAAAAQDFP